MSVVMRFGNSVPAPGRFGNLPPAVSLQTRIRAAVRRCIAEEVERLVDMLDALDGNPDEEPSLGWTKTMAWGSTDDREEDATITFDG